MHHWLDWTILSVVFLFMVYGVLISRKYMRSVSDFLAAGRAAGRYLISVALGMAMLGAITVVGEFEMFFKSGFCLKWWELFMAVAILLISVSGWVVYRFRQTRCLTLAQFFEIRYSRRFRVFAGILAFGSGIINFGIFPAVSTRFFIYYLGLPPTFGFIGITWSTYATLMALLLLVTFYFVFSGGQVAVIIADFIQGAYSNIVFVILILYSLTRVKWSQISQALATVPADASLHHPFHSGRVEDFNFWFFLIGLIGLIYNTMSWQGTQAYNASAKSAHEAKMAQVLSNWRNFPRNLFLMFIPIIAFTILRHPDFSGVSARVGEVLQSVTNVEVQSQLRTPLALRFFLPVGLLGAFAAMMLSAFIGCTQSYLHSWGSIFIQDVVMPFRKKPFAPKQHLLLLRLAIVGVAAFIYLFSLFFRQTEHIYLFFAITGAIFVGGSGAVIIGGLYWRRGTTVAAWSSLITGSTVAVAGIILNDRFPDFPINGQWFWGMAMVTSTLVYILVSLLGGKHRRFDLDKLLHRGEHAFTAETQAPIAVPARGWRMLGMGREFTGGDRLIYILSYAWILCGLIVFILGTVYNLLHPASDSAWLEFWKIYVYAYLSVSVVVVIWFTIGGLHDMKAMFRQLGTMKRDDADDGFVARGERPGG